MTAVALPSLSGNGWITDPTIMLKTLLTNCLVSDYSQSNIYNGTITSFQYIVARFQHKENELVNELETHLKNYIQKFFIISNISVTVSDRVTDNLFDLYISVTVTHDNKTYSLATVAAVKDGLLSNVLEVLNGQ